jgi:hypothetical protein
MEIDNGLKGMVEISHNKKIQFGSQKEMSGLSSKMSIWHSNLEIASSLNPLLQRKPLMDSRKWKFDQALARFHLKIRSHNSIKRNCKSKKMDDLISQNYTL